MPAPITPIVERITLDIVDWLNQVKPANGYLNSFTVERVKRQGNAPRSGETLAVVIQGSPIMLQRASQDDTGWDQPYYIDIFVDPDESRDTPLDADINSAVADAQKSLTFEGISKTRGGLAFDTTLRTPILFRQGTNHGVRVPIVVRYFTQFNNPYKSAYSNIP